MCEENELKTRICSKCHIELNLTLEYFATRKDNKLGFNTICKICNKKYHKQYRENNKEKLKKEHDQYYIDNKEKKKKYAKKYYINNKNEFRIRSKKYSENNKEKLIEYMKVYREKNRERMKEYDKHHRENNKEHYKEYNEKNKEKRKQYNKEYRKEYEKINKDKIREKRKERRINNMAFKLRYNISSQIRYFLFKNQSSKHGKSCWKYLPYTAKQLKEHIESQFIGENSWMTWQNHGIYNADTWNDNDKSTWTWNLDHISPQSDLPYTSMEDENFKKCWALSNLRPLSAKINIIEGASKVRHKKKD
jgi:hypothetical protein